MRAVSGPACSRRVACACDPAGIAGRARAQSLRLEHRGGRKRETDSDEPCPSCGAKERSLEWGRPLRIVKEHQRFVTYSQDSQSDGADQEGGGGGSYATANALQGKEEGPC